MEFSARLTQLLLLLLLLFVGMRLLASLKITFEHVEQQKKTIHNSKFNETMNLN